jgi:hypothetical protein
MPLTDEQILDAYIEEGGIRPGSRRLNMPLTTVRLRLQQLQAAGVYIPRMNRRGSTAKQYSKERVEFLNEYIRQKTEAKSSQG